MVFFLGEYQQCKLFAKIVETKVVNMPWHDTALRRRDACLASLGSLKALRSFSDAGTDEK